MEKVAVKLSSRIELSRAGVIPALSMAHKLPSSPIIAVTRKKEASIKKAVKKISAAPSTHDERPAHNIEVA